MELHLSLLCKLLVPCTRIQLQRESLGETSKGLIGRPVGIQLLGFQELLSGNEEQSIMYTFVPQRVKPR